MPGDETQPPAALPPIPTMPKCPHCGADPIYIAAQKFNVGPLETLLLCCRECRTLLKIVEMGLLEGAMPAPGSAARRIVEPS